MLPFVMNLLSQSKPMPEASYSGSSMDRLRSKRPPWHRRAIVALLAALALSSLALLFWQRPLHSQLVESPQLAKVTAGEFRDELSLRAKVEPIGSVQLDATEAGRVEAVYVHDGDWVEAGAKLYLLDSPEQEQLLMQRSAEVAQQMANVSVQRSALAASLAQNRRELTQLQAAQEQALSDYQRLAKFAGGGFVSAAEFERSQRQERLATQLLEQARHDQQVETQTRRQSLEEMMQAVQGLQRGLTLLQRSHDRLEQHAPIAGRISGFELQVGGSVRPGDRLGRIDDLTSGVQLVSDVDEYYLPRLQLGESATSGSGTLAVFKTLPQIQGGKVRVLLRWSDRAAAQSNLRPGQAVDLRLQLSAPSPALLLPEGPGVQAQLYVRQGKVLERRTVRLGRHAAGQVEVLAGLYAGEEVLISQPPSDAERLALP